MSNKARPVVLALAGALLALTLAACGAGSRQDHGPALPPPAAAPAMPDPGRTDDAGFGSVGSGLDAAVLPPDERRIIMSAELRIDVADLDAALTAVRGLVTTHRGYLQESRLRTSGDGSKSATLVLRVPVGGYGSLIDALGTLGDVRARDEWTDDVTEEFIDLEARLEARREQETRLRALIRESATLEDLIRLENEIARVRGEIESIQGRLTFLRSRVDLSTIRLNMVEPPPGALKTVGLSSRMGQAFSQSLRDLAHFTEELAVYSARALPSLVFLGAIVLVVVALARAVKRRRRGATPGDDGPVR